MGFLDDAKKMAHEHAAQVEQGIEKVGDLVDSKTDGKYADKVDTAQEKAAEFLTGGDRQREETPGA